MSEPNFARRDCVLLVELERCGGLVPPRGQWAPGPYPFATADYTTDAPTRMTYFYPRVEGVLYGTASSPRRWHQALDLDVAGARAIAVEVVLGPSAVQPEVALCALHVELAEERPLENLAALVILVDGGPTRGVVDSLVHDLGMRCRVDARRATSLAYVTLASDAISPPPGDRAAAGAVDQWLWAFASATPAHRFAPDPEADLPAPTRLSASWRCMVLRDGVGFVGLRPQDSDSYLQDIAPMLVRSIYTDAVILGVFQRLAFNGLADELGTIDWAAGTSRLRAVEQRLSTIRNAVWGAHATRHGHANDILMAYQRQHRLDDLVDEVQTELTEASRLADLENARRIELLLTILTVVSAAAALTTVWNDYGVVVFVLTATTSVALIAMIYLFVLRR